MWALPFAFGTRFRAEQTPLAISYGGEHLDDALVQPGSKPLPDGTSRLDAVFAGNGSQADYAGLSARGKAVVVRSGDVVSADQAAAAAQAGAAMLLVVNQEPGRLSDLWCGKSDFSTAGPFPAASVTLDEGEELIKRITTAGKKRVQLAIEAHPTPKYLYDLADYHIGAVPEDPSADTDPRSLARIDLDFALPSGKHCFEKRNDYPPYQWPGEFSFQYGKVLRLPFEKEPVAPGPRTDWVSARAGVPRQQFATMEKETTHTDTMIYKPGSEQKDRWFGPLIRPRLLSDDALLRYPDGSLGANIDGFGDAGSAHSGGARQMISFYQGDRQLTQVPWPNLNVPPQTPEKLPYRLVVDTTGGTELSPYSTTTNTEWRFTSGAVTDPRKIPLVQLDYETDPDMEGRAERRTGIAIRPTVLSGASTQDTVSSLVLEVSYDDGETWQAQKLKGRKGTWQASLIAPSEAEYVSIRVTAEQQSGGVTQTVTRAFGLKP
ncbi:PA domain-containing protein [Streptomyces sp. NPDC004044]